MQDPSETNQMLLRELASLKQRIAELERSESERKRTYEALQKNEKLYRSLVENTNETIMVIQDGMIKFVNNIASETFSYSQQEFLSIPVFELIHPEDRDAVVQRYRQKINGDTRPTRHAYRGIRKDGHTTWMQISSVLIDWENRPATLNLITNITEQKKLEEALRESELTFRTLFEAANDAIFLIDKNIFIDCNPKTLEMFSCTREQIIGHAPFQFSPEVQPDGRNSAEKAIEKNNAALKGQPQLFEWKHRRYDGTLFDVEVSLNAFPAKGKYYIHAIARDITARKEIEKALQESEKRYHELSIVDDLTRLYNSRHFYVQLNNELERSKRYGQSLALLMLDLDDFKIFNDTYGHIEGDEVLSRLGQVIKRCLRETDIAFRYGGEEFTILLPMTTSAEGTVIAERIRKEFKQESFSPKPDRKAHLTVSVGIGQYEPGEDMRAFVHRVDLLMYQAKKNGKDRVCPAT